MSKLTYEGIEEKVKEIEGNTNRLFRSRFYKPSKKYHLFKSEAIKQGIPEEVFEAVVRSEIQNNNMMDLIRRYDSGNLRNDIERNKDLENALKYLTVRLKNYVDSYQYDDLGIFKDRRTAEDYGLADIFDMVYEKVCEDVNRGLNFLMSNCIDESRNNISGNLERFLLRENLMNAFISFNKLSIREQIKLGEVERKQILRKIKAAKEAECKLTEIKESDAVISIYERIIEDESFRVKALDKLKKITPSPIFNKRERGFTIDYLTILRRGVRISNGGKTIF